MLCHQDAENGDHLFGVCRFAQEVYYYVDVLFSFPWHLPFTTVVQLMNKLSKRNGAKGSYDVDAVD